MEITGRLLALALALAANPQPAAAGAVPAGGPDDPPVITSFRLQGGAPTVLPGTTLTLDHTVSGRAPTGFRVSLQPDFRDASWLPYERAPRWTPPARRYVRGGVCGPLGAPLVIYFQVRAAETGIAAERLRGHSDGAGHVLSNVASGTICVLLGEGAGVY